MSSTPRPGRPAAGSGPEGSTPPPVGGSHKGWIIFFLVVIFFAALAFGFKFYEFFLDLASQEGFRFAGAHLATYLLVAAGFFLLLIYAFLKGHFSDIERPKYDLLDQERRYDREEFERPPAGR